MIKKSNCPKKYKTLFLCTLVLFVTAIGLRIYYSSNMAVRNNELKALYDQKVDLEKAVTNLTYIDSGLSSLKHVEQRASVLGFVPMNGNLRALDPYAATPVAALSQR